MLKKQIYGKFLVLLLFIVESVFANEIILTIPKSGTNLILKCIQKITGKSTFRHASALQKDPVWEDTLFWAHSWKCCESDRRSLAPTEEKLLFCQKHNVKVILQYRDPRDLICALARVTQGDLSHKNIQAIIENPADTLVAAGANEEAYKEFHSLTDCYENYFQWAKYPNVFVASFEHLVGEKGGGDAQMQIEEVLKLAEFLEVDLSYSQAIKIAQDLFGNTPTFKKGLCGSWKTVFSKENIALFSQKESFSLQENFYP